MKQHYRAGYRVALAVLLAGQTVAASGQAPAAPASSLTRTEMEAFLQNAKITRMRSAGKGVTNSQRATLTDGNITHDAHIQTVDVSKLEFRGTRGTELNFRDSYRYNLAGYRLDKVLDLNVVPVSIERRIEGKPAAVTWWIDDVMMDEGERRKKDVRPDDPRTVPDQLQLMRVFDELIQNTDRNMGNIQWTNDWKMWLIDHTRAFRIGTKLQTEALLLRCERSLLDRLRRLDADVLSRELGDSVRKEEIRALLVRRDLIVQRFDAQVAQKGEEAVFYTLTR